MMIQSQETQKRPSCDYYQEATLRLQQIGFSSAQIEMLRDEFGLFATDNVTGFYDGRSGPARFVTLVNAIRHVKEMGERAFYIDMDLRNLSGLNAKLTHAGANEVFGAIASIIRKELSKIASEALFFRHGGDEMSAFLINTTLKLVLTANEAVQSEVLRLAKNQHLDTIPHPKHLNDPQQRGIGIHFGVCELSEEYENYPELVFEQADSKLEEMKRSMLVAEGD